MHSTKISYSHLKVPIPSTDSTINKFFDISFLVSALQSHLRASKYPRRCCLLLILFINKFSFFCEIVVKRQSSKSIRHRLCLCISVAHTFMCGRDEFILLCTTASVTCLFASFNDWLEESIFRNTREKTRRKSVFVRLTVTDSALSWNWRLLSGYTWGDYVYCYL